MFTERCSRMEITGQEGTMLALLHVSRAGCWCLAQQGSGGSQSLRIRDFSERVCGCWLIGSWKEQRTMSLLHRQRRRLVALIVAVLLLTIASAAAAAAAGDATPNRGRNHHQQMHANRM